MNRLIFFLHIYFLYIFNIIIFINNIGRIIKLYFEIKEIAKK